MKRINQIISFIALAMAYMVSFANTDVLEEQIPTESNLTDNSKSWLWGVSSFDLYTIDLNTRIATLQNFEGVDFEVYFDISFLPNGSLFGISGTGKLVRFDINELSASVVGDTGYMTINSLAPKSDNEFFAATVNGELLVINSESGNTNYIGDFGSNLISSGDLAVSSFGELFGVAKSNCPGNCSPEYLVTINSQTGEATIIGDTGFSEIFGLAFSPSGDLFAISNSNSNSPKLLTIDIHCGSASFIGEISNTNGLTGLDTNPIVFRDGFE